MDNGLIGEGSSDGEESTAPTVIVDLGSQQVLPIAGGDEQGTLDRVTDNLINAARTGNYDLVFGLLESGTFVDSSNEYQQTALMWALKEGHNDVARLLIEKGANIHLQNENEEEAILWAAEANNIGGVNLLLNKGANVIDQKGELFISDMMGDNFLLGEHPEVKTCLNAHKAKLERFANAMIAADIDHATILEVKKYSRTDMINILKSKLSDQNIGRAIRIYDQAMDSIRAGVAVVNESFDRPAKKARPK